MMHPIQSPAPISMRVIVAVPLLEPDGVRVVALLFALLGVGRP